MATVTLDRTVAPKRPLPTGPPATGSPAPVWLPPARPAGAPDGPASAARVVVPLRRGRPVADPPVRLTRRGRLAVTLLVLAAALVIAGIARHSVGQPADRAATPGSVVVAPGDTLWEVAVRADPQADPQVTVARIVELNDLSGGELRPGQRLRLPAR